MSLTTVVATAVRARDIFGSITPPPDGGPAIPTGIYDDLPSHSAHSISATGAIAITASSLSLIAAAFTTYWFTRMRRRYRHNLIMLLIASNTWRAIWRLLFPLIEYIKVGIFPTNSAFCQVSGFFTSQGVEATDTAVLLIALHSALSVFCKTPSHREGGLYPYRWWALAFWVIFPILISGLAFANPDTPNHAGYTAQGSICYLPSRPFTYINLTWVPRYVVAAVVLVVYSTIYIYATHKSHQYSEEIRRTDYMETSEKPRWFQRFRSWFGKERSNQQPHQKENLMTAREMRNLGQGLHWKRNHSGNVRNSPYPNPHYPLDSSLVLDTTGSPPSIHHPRLADGAFGFPAHELQELTRTQTSERQAPSNDRNAPDGEAARTVTDTTDASSSAAVDFAQGVAGTAEELEAPQIKAPQDKNHKRSYLGIPIRHPSSVRSRQSSQSSPSTTDSLVSLASSAPSSAGSSILSKTDTQNDVPKMVATSQILAQHERMRRQLRYLFLYPAVYILLYIPAFVNHLLRAYRSYYSDPSFALSAVVVLAVSIQAAVDCVLFTWIEKPWRHIPGSDGSFLGSFKCFEIRKRRQRGQTQDPADVTERLAQQLRDLERLDERSLASDLSRPRLKVKRSENRSPPAERYWWEQYEDDEDGMSTRRRSSNRRVSGTNYIGDEEDQRGRMGTRRVSFPDEYGRELERVFHRPRSESFPSANRSRSSRSSSNRRRSRQDFDTFGQSQSELAPGNEDRDKDRDDADASQDAEAFDEIPLNDDENGRQGDNDEELPPEPMVVETDDHG